MNMTTDNCVVGHNHIIADNTIVGNMRVNHQHTAVADNGCLMFFRGASVDGNIFANNIVFADNDFGAGDKFIAMVLRTGTQTSARKNNRSVTDGGVAVNSYPADKFNIFTYFCLSADPAKRSYLCAVGYFCTVFDKGCRMYFCHLIFRPFLFFVICSQFNGYLFCWQNTKFFLLLQETKDSFGASFLHI